MKAALLSYLTCYQITVYNTVGHWAGERQAPPLQGLLIPQNNPEFHDSGWGLHNGDRNWWRGECGKFDKWKIG